MRWMRVLGVVISGAVVLAGSGCGQGDTPPAVGEAEAGGSVTTREASLSVAASGEREVVMSREFAAPPARVFEALTEPELIRRWLLGPPGWAMVVCEVDAVEGGAFRYVWRHEADGAEMGMGGTYREVDAPRRMVHTESFDEPWYPGGAVVTTALDERAGLTTLTVTVRYENPEARDMVLDSGMAEGVAASYDRLAALVEADRER